MLRSNASRLPRIAVIAIVAAALFAALTPVASSQETDGTTGTVVAVVKYKTDDGKAPLEGVEVWLFDGSQSYYDCTDAAGKVTFEGIEAGVDLRSATGIGRVGECSNWEYLNPDTGEKMLNNSYKKHHGIYTLPTFFQVGGGEKVKIFFTVKTPKGQKKVCGGMLATMLGTSDDDVMNGTEENDIIVGKGGMDTIHGNGGNDIICGGKVGDLLYGDEGWDIIYGEQGSDTMDGGPDKDQLWGGDGNDTCSTGETVFDCETII